MSSTGIFSFGRAQPGSRSLRSSSSPAAASGACGNAPRATTTSSVSLYMSSMPLAARAASGADLHRTDGACDCVPMVILSPWTYDSRRYRPAALFPDSALLRSCRIRALRTDVRRLSRRRRQGDPPRRARAAGDGIGAAADCLDDRTGRGRWIRRGLRRVQSAGGADERLAAGQRHPASERRRRRSSRPGQPRGRGGARRGASGQRVDRWHLRRHVWCALRPLEIRPRSGQHDSRPGDRPRASPAG